MPKINIEIDGPIVVLPAEEYEALLETIEILSNPELVKDIEDGLKAYHEGRTKSFTELRAKLQPITNGD